MPEETLLNLGHKPKILNCYDKTTNKIIQITLELKENITEYYLKTFFNKIYSMKLDRGYSESFIENKSTGDLILSFQNILTENNLINLNNLKELLNQDIMIKANPVGYAIQEFFDLFTVTDISYTKLSDVNSDNSLLELEYIKQGKTRIKVRSNYKKTVA